MRRLRWRRRQRCWRYRLPFLQPRDRVDWLAWPNEALCTHSAGNSQRFDCLWQQKAASQTASPSPSLRLASRWSLVNCRWSVRDVVSSSFASAATLALPDCLPGQFARNSRPTDSTSQGTNDIASGIEISASSFFSFPLCVTLSVALSRSLVQPRVMMISGQNRRVSE